MSLDKTRPVGRPFNLARRHVEGGPVRLSCIGLSVERVFGGFHVSDDFLRRSVRNRQAEQWRSDRQPK